MEKRTRRFYMNFYRPVSILQALVRGFLVRVRIIEKTKYEYNELEKNIYIRSIGAGISSVLIDSLMNELVIGSFRISLDRVIDMPLQKKDPFDMTTNISFKDHQKMSDYTSDKQKLLTKNRTYDRTYGIPETLISKGSKHNDQSLTRNSMQSYRYLHESSIANKQGKTKTNEEYHGRIKFDRLTDQSHTYEGCNIKATNNMNHSTTFTCIEPEDDSESTTTLQQYQDDESKHKTKSSTRFQHLRKRQQVSNNSVDDIEEDLIIRPDLCGTINNIENQIRSARENLKDCLGINSYV